MSRTFSSPQQHLAPGGERLQLLFGELAHLRVAALGQFLGSGDVLLEALVFAELLDQRLELRQGFARFLELGGVGLHFHRADAGHQLFVTRFDGREFVEHVSVR